MFVFAVQKTFKIILSTYFIMWRPWDSNLEIPLPENPELAVRDKDVCFATYFKIIFILTCTDRDVLMATMNIAAQFLL